MSIDHVYSLVGIVAAFLTSTGLLPQAIKGYRTRSLEDVSSGMLRILIGGTLLWILYGIHKQDTIIVGANIFTCLISISILLMKQIYSRK